jgi:hypothetical protein
MVSNIRPSLCIRRVEEPHLISHPGSEMMGRTLALLAAQLKDRMKTPLWFRCGLRRWHEAMALYKRLSFRPTGETSRFPPPRSQVTEHQQARILRAERK